MSNSQEPSKQVEWRLLLALLLSSAILFAFPYVYQRLYPAQPQKQPQQAVKAPVAPPPPAPEKVKKEPEIESKPPSSPAAPTHGRAHLLEVANDDLVLAWNTRGAILESATLQKFRDEKGDVLELIPQRLDASMARPLTIETGDKKKDEILSQAVYEVSPQIGARVSAPVELEFHFAGAGLEVTRKIAMPASGYDIRVQTEVRYQGEPIAHQVVLGTGIGDLTDQGDFAYPDLVYHADGSVERYRVKDLSDGPVTLETSPRWVAENSKYFSYALLAPDAVEKVHFSSQELKLQSPEGKEETHQLLRAELSMKEGSSYRFFLGPKDFVVLRGMDPTLTELIDYGWFAILVKPLLFALKIVYSYVHNYGWAIIILTFIINLALFPVRYKQMISMKKMSALQPQLKSIQDRYKRMKRDDPRRTKMNEEVMALYREHGVNPLGGCLPMVVQMPFLFAFYRMLAYSIELRAAPFIFWIHDLSQHDPYYVTPLVMGLAMVLQQKMTPMNPSTGDKTQQRMMMFMPIVMTFLFLRVSSGLALYFLFSNVFGMMFQLLAQKWKPELALATPTGGKGHRGKSQKKRGSK